MKKDKKTKSYWLGLRLTQEDGERLERLAAKNQEPTSQTARKILRKGLDRE